ncbi:hypothetical protein BD779DRAFT_1668489 [Infundibulicybe gibba]|nr:hypothetical protein BD779DRAFT_1668489 [Infundibulicybe gibba]
MTRSFTTFILTILAALAIVSAAPTAARDVFVPPVLTPCEGAIWKIGSQQNVTWNVTEPPKMITNRKGMIVLSYGGRLNLTHPLATNFDILDGNRIVEVPDVKPGDDYKVVVFGDSGNSGQRFSIVQ